MRVLRYRNGHYVADRVSKTDPAPDVALAVSQGIVKIKVLDSCIEVIDKWSGEVTFVLRKPEDIAKLQGLLWKGVLNGC